LVATPLFRGRGLAARELPPRRHLISRGPSPAMQRGHGTARGASGSIHARGSAARRRPRWQAAAVAARSGMMHDASEHDRERHTAHDGGVVRRQLRVPALRASSERSRAASQYVVQPATGGARPRRGGRRRAVGGWRVFARALGAVTRQRARCVGDRQAAGRRAAGVAGTRAPARHRPQR
jgi:hypothetical protein